MFRHVRSCERQRADHSLAFAATGILVFGRIALLGILLAALPGFAAEDDQVIYPGGPAKGEMSAAPRAAGLNSLTLAAALLLAGAGGWMFWKNKRGATAARGAQALAIEETRSLGNRQYLVVASYEGRKFLLGVCPGQIRLISPLEERSGATGTPS